MTHMSISKAELNEYRLHAVTILTGAAAGLSQIDDLAQYSPVAAALAFFVASTSYYEALRKVDDVIHILEDANIIDEDVADVVEELIDVVEAVVDAVDDDE